MNRFEIERSQSETRQQIGDLLGLETRDDTQENELRAATKKLNQLETDFQAALALDKENERKARAAFDGEDKERNELRSKVKLGAYVESALEGRGAVTGAELEFNQSQKIPADRFPLELLAGAEKRTNLETRATTDAEAGATQSTWLDRLFADTSAMYLGVTFQDVMPGISAHPVTSAGASAAQRGRTDAAADSSWKVDVKEIKSTRNSVRAVFSEQDSYRLPGLEAALQRDLAMALTEGIDRIIFVGDTAAGEDASDIAGFNGITAAATGLVERTLKQADKVKAPNTLATFAAAIDGKHASSMSDLRVVASVGANTLWLSQIAAAAADTKTVAQFLKENGLMWMTRGDLETATDNGDFGAYVAGSRGIEGAAVAAVWASAQLVRDPYSNSAKGEIALTLNTYWGFDVVRPSHFSRLKFVN